MGQPPGSDDGRRTNERMVDNMLNTICLDCKKLNNGCKGTECKTWTGCIYKEKTELNAIDKIKADTRKYLESLGYNENQMAFIDDIVSLARPGVVLIKEKICGEYTGKLSELYL